VGREAAHAPGALERRRFGVVAGWWTWKRGVELESDDGAEVIKEGRGTRRAAMHRRARGSLCQLDAAHMMLSAGETEGGQKSEDDWLCIHGTLIREQS